MNKRSAIVLPALAAALLVPASANAGTLALSKTCYAEGEAVNFTGGGFTHTLVPSVPVAYSGTPTPAAFAGAFSAPIQPDNRTNAVSTETFTVTDATDGTQTASASYQLVNFAADFGTSFKSAKAKRTWSFSGFPVGLPVYGHFRRGGKKVVDYKFGVAPAPCGQFTKRAPGVPKRKAKFGKYTIQLDNAPKYSAATRPAYRASFKVIKVFK